MKQKIILTSILFFLCVIIFTNDNKTNSLPILDYIVVEKSKRKMKVYSRNILIKEYKISLGFNPIGSKEREGDGKTPEGEYYIIKKKPKSRYYLSMEISYPNIEEEKIAKEKNISPGSAIMIHGLHKGFGWIGKMHLLKDWTLGCIAVTNEEMKEIYYATPLKTKVKIYP